MHRGSFMLTPTPPLSGLRTSRPGAAPVCVCVPLLAGLGGPASRARFGAPHHFLWTVPVSSLFARPPPGSGCPVCCCCCVFLSSSLFSSPFALCAPVCCGVPCFADPGCLGPWRLVVPPRFLFSLFFLRSPLPVFFFFFPCVPFLCFFCFFFPPPPFFFLPCRAGCAVWGGFCVLGCGVCLCVWWLWCPVLCVDVRRVVCCCSLWCVVWFAGCCVACLCWAGVLCLAVRRGVFLGLVVLFLLCSAVACCCVFC